VQTIPLDQIVHAFLELCVNVVPQDRLGEVKDVLWQYTPRYVVWYGRVSHPKFLPPIDGSPLRLANQEQIIAQEHARDMPNSLEIIRSCVHIADEALAHDLTREEMLEALRQISSTSQLALTRKHQNTDCD
jgi:hypothetical protein